MQHSFTVGALAYIDTIYAGLIPCKVVAIREGGDGRRIGLGDITVKVTAKRPGYFVGELVERQLATNIVPRSMVYRRGGHYRICSEYTWNA